MTSLRWVPLPQGRAWWPGIVLDIHSLDQGKHVDAVKFWEAMRRERGYDVLNKDVLVCLCGVAGSQSEQGFAVVPRTSLRPFHAYLNTFETGVISSGKHSGQPCGDEERQQLKLVLSSILDIVKRPTPSLMQHGSNSHASLTSSTPSNRYKSSRQMVEEHKELNRLKKELIQLRRKIGNKSGSRAQSASPPPNIKVESPLPTTNEVTPVNAQQFITGMQYPPQYYPELSSRVIRIWDFCHSFSRELNLTIPASRTPFASITSFEACLAEQECALFAHIACQLVSYLSASTGPETEDRWDFTNGLKAKMGSRCTALTWECLWETLVENQVLPQPSNPNDKAEILDDIIHACGELKSIRNVFGWRLTAFASELSNPMESQASNLAATPFPIEVRPSPPSANPVQIQVLTSEVLKCMDFYQVETLIDTCRTDHERVNPETGYVVVRTYDLNNALIWEEKLFAKVLFTIKTLSLGKRARSLSFGKDHFGRSLFSFAGDEDEEECRVWARVDDTDRWFLYRGHDSILKLTESVPDRECRNVLIAILYSSRKRYRPSSLASHRLAKNVGWRFTHNQLLGEKVIKYDFELGLCVGYVASWRFAGVKGLIFRVVFSGQEWETGVDMSEPELLYLLTRSASKTGDLPMSVVALPPHPFQIPWVPLDSAQTDLVLVHGHHKKLIGLGVVLATTPIAPDGECDALVLQDGGEFVTIFGKKNLFDAVALGRAYSAPGTVVLDGQTVPRVNRVERFHPLTLHVGPTVGLQGVVKLWGSLAIDSISGLQQPMLASEQAFVTRAPSMWPSPAAGEAWRDLVRRASTVKDYALALECLLDYAHMAQEKGYFTPPPQPMLAQPSEPEVNEAKRNIQDPAPTEDAKRFKAEDEPVEQEHQQQEEEVEENLAALQEDMEDAERVMREASTDDPKPKAESDPATQVAATEKAHLEEPSGGDESTRNAESASKARKQSVAEPATSSPRTKSPLSSLIEPASEPVMQDETSLHLKDEEVGEQSKANLEVSDNIVKALHEEKVVESLVQAVAEGLQGSSTSSISSDAHFKVAKDQAIVEVKAEEDEQGKIEIVAKVEVIPEQSAVNPVESQGESVASVNADPSRSNDSVGEAVPEKEPQSGAENPEISDAQEKNDEAIGLDTRPPPPPPPPPMVAEEAAVAPDAPPESSTE